MKILYPGKDEICVFHFSEFEDLPKTMNVWAIYLVGALSGAWYLWQVPVTIVLYLDEAGAGSGIGAFVYEGAFKRALKRRGVKRKKKGSLTKPKRKAMKYLLSKVHVQRLSVTGAVNTGDAALTALSAGAFCMIGYVFPKTVNAEVRADFGSGKTDLVVFGMMWVKLGHIMLSGMGLLFETLKERRAVWKSTRSKGL